MTLPSTIYILDQNPGRDVIELDESRDRVRTQLGAAFENRWDQSRDPPFALWDPRCLALADLWASWAK